MNKKNSKLVEILEDGGNGYEDAVAAAQKSQHVGNTNGRVEVCYQYQDNQYKFTF
jgi:hypothetical protein